MLTQQRRYGGMIKLTPLKQLGNHGSLVLVTDGAISKTDKQGIGGVDTGAGQTKEQSKAAGHAVKKPAATDIRM